MCSNMKELQNRIAAAQSDIEYVFAAARSFITKSPLDRKSQRRQAVKELATVLRTLIGSLQELKLVLLTAENGDVDWNQYNLARFGAIEVNLLDLRDDLEMPLFQFEGAEEPEQASQANWPFTTTQTRTFCDGLAVCSGDIKLALSSEQLPTLLKLLSLPLNEESDANLVVTPYQIRADIVDWETRFFKLPLPVDPVKTFRQHLDRRAPGSHLWIDDNPELSQWLHGDHPAPLCIYGEAGAGKTFVMSGIISKACSQLNKSSAICFWFLAPSQESLNTTYILRTMVCQLASQSHLAWEALRAELKTFWARRPSHEYVNHPIHAETLEEAGGPLSENFLMQVLRAMCRKLQRVYIVVDGLDHLKDNDHRLLAYLSELSGLPMTRAAISCRDPQFTHLMPLICHLTMFSLKACHLKDITLYVDHRAREFYDTKQLGPKFALGELSLELWQAEKG